MNDQDMRWFDIDGPYRRARRSVSNLLGLVVSLALLAFLAFGWDSPVVHEVLKVVGSAM